MIKSISMAVGTLSLLVTSVALAQTGNMMEGGGHGWGVGYGGFWGGLLLGALVVAVILLLMNRRPK